ncbi:MAG: hypothetical protein ACXAD7_24050 [Candidatus Kariarchaeaceae archaeon]|jgi:hypothetical protein
MKYSEKSHKLLVNLHLAISYFDDIYGPQIIEILPTLNEKNRQSIRKLLQQLIDIASFNERQEWQFMYSDSLFASQNLKLSLVNMNVRGHITDFMISLIVTPGYSHATSAIALNWNLIQKIKNHCLEPFIRFIETNDLANTRRDIKAALIDIYKELKLQIINQLESSSPEVYFLED